jgi:hypothetical protein
MTDEDRESLIDASYEQMIAATDEATQRKHLKDMCYHVKLRSPEQVFKMEVERRISTRYARLFTYDSAPNEELPLPHTSADSL